jgi:hypothetical protein
MSLLDILTDAENQLGCLPLGNHTNMPKARALTHHVMFAAMNKRGLTENDLVLALAYCVRRRLPLDSPLELLGMVDAARQATHVPRRHDLDLACDDAIAWESMRADEDTQYWITRVVRSSGPARQDTLDEWRDAGRGE